MTQQISIAVMSTRDFYAPLRVAIGNNNGAALIEPSDRFDSKVFDVYVCACLSGKFSRRTNHAMAEAIRQHPDIREVELTSDEFYLEYNSNELVTRYLVHFNKEIPATEAKAILEEALSEAQYAHGYQRQGIPAEDDPNNFTTD